MKRAVWLLLLVGLGCAVACGKKDAESKAGPAAQGDRPADQPKAFDEYATHLDLWEHAHLAEVDHHGLYIEFGGPTRAKYTYGEWRSGFGKDGAAGADTFTYANADSSRVYFSVDQAEALTLRLRMKPVETPGGAKPWATALFTPYLNGEALPAASAFPMAIIRGRVRASESAITSTSAPSVTVSHGTPPHAVTII